MIDLPVSQTLTKPLSEIPGTIQPALSAGGRS
jgi:hypothetical protein